MKRSPLVRKTPMRSKPPAPAKRERAPAGFSVLPESLRRGAVMQLAQATIVAVPKEDRHSSEAWRRAVAEIPCVFCGAPAQAAHRNVGKGFALKTDDCLTAALCPSHHSEIDQGKALNREQRRAELDRAIVLTLRALVHAGKVVLA